MRPATSDYPFVIRQAADVVFVDHVLKLIDENIERFKINGPETKHRKFWTLTDDIDPVVAAKKQELVERFGFKDWVIDPTFLDLIGHITEGGVHPHTDDDIDGRLHIRMNLLVSKPLAGCVPVLDEIPIEIDTGDAWLCFASQCQHATTPVVGDKFRSIISYGLQVHRVEAFGRLAQYLAWRNAHAPAAAAQASSDQSLARST